MILGTDLLILANSQKLCPRTYRSAFGPNGWKDNESLSFSDRCKKGDVMLSCRLSFSPNQTSRVLSQTSWPCTTKTAESIFLISGPAAIGLCVHSSSGPWVDLRNMIFLLRRKQIHCFVQEHRCRANLLHISHVIRHQWAPSALYVSQIS